ANQEIEVDTPKNEILKAQYTTNDERKNNTMTISNKNGIPNWCKKHHQDEGKIKTKAQKYPLKTDQRYNVNKRKETCCLKRKEIVKRLYRLPTDDKIPLPETNFEETF
ncbi:1811_t:CDS:2, partial [Gigaspora rosea]